MFTINANLLSFLIGTFAALVVGSVLRLIALRKSPAKIVSQRLNSLKVWWLLAGMWLIAAVFGQIGATVLFATASYIGMREFLKLIGTPAEIGPPAIASLIGLGAGHYLLIACGLSTYTKLLFPIEALLLLGAIRETTCSPDGYIRTTAGLFWGAMLMIYSFSHALYLFDVRTNVEPPVGIAGEFLFLVLLTEVNDIMQAIVGRKWGVHKITPGVSPNKSLEGFLGGLTATVILAIALAPFLTTFTIQHGTTVGLLLAGLAGVLIATAGFLGDINMSAIKRDVGVKDGSGILPGMGGVIDRIDSLIFTAPVFYYFVIAATNANQI